MPRQVKHITWRQSQLEVSQERGETLIISREHMTSPQDIPTCVLTVAQSTHPSFAEEAEELIANPDKIQAMINDRDADYWETEDTVYKWHIRKDK